MGNHRPFADDRPGSVQLAMNQEGAVLAPDRANQRPADPRGRQRATAARHCSIGLTAAATATTREAAAGQRLGRQTCNGTNALVSRRRLCRRSPTVAARASEREDRSEAGSGSRRRSGREFPLVVRSESLSSSGHETCSRLDGVSGSGVVACRGFHSAVRAGINPRFLDAGPRPLREPTHTHGRRRSRCRHG
jgi:hypothetical protein